MIATFQEFIAPYDPTEFSRMLRAGEIVFRRGSHRGRMNGLLDWDVMLRLAADGTIPAKNIRIVRDSRSLPHSLFLRDGKVGAERLLQLFEHGASLVITSIDLYCPSLAVLRDDIGSSVGESVTIGAIATTGGGGALSLHYDPEDLAIVQIEGSKRWLIYGEPVRSPVRGMPKQQEPCGPPIFDEVLHAGDFLFVPAGHWHRCENGPGRSVHAGILFEPSTGLQRVEQLVAELITDEDFRAPLNRRMNSAERAAYEARLKARLTEKIAQLFDADG